MPSTRHYIYSVKGEPESKPEPAIDMDSFICEGNVAVLAITAHGDIQVEYHLDNPIQPTYNIVTPVRFEIPDDMEIIGIEVVSPSVPNLLPPKNTLPFLKIIKEETSGFNENTTVDEMTAMVSSIKNKLSDLDDQPYDVINQFRQKNTNYTEDEDVRAYFYHTDLLYRINNYKVINPFNKEYLRENKLITNNKRSRNFYDWKINILNSIPEIDLMSVLNQRVESLRSSSSRSEFTITRLQKIIEYLHNKGIKKIILIDFSCSVIRRKTSGVTEREERYIALEHNRTRGGRKRKNTRKYRNNKTRKQRK